MLVTSPSTKHTLVDFGDGGTPVGESRRDVPPIVEKAKNCNDSEVVELSPVEPCLAGDDSDIRQVPESTAQMSQRQQLNEMD